MKIIITILFCFFLLSSCQLSSLSHRSCLVKITDKEGSLKYGGNDVWDPGVLNRTELEKAIKQFLKSPAKKNQTVIPKDILENLPIYTIEYAGIIKDFKKIIVCQMVIEYDDEACPKNRGIFTKNHFSTILDGGCSNVILFYDANAKKIIYLACNGSA